MESGNWKAEAALGALVTGVLLVFVYLTFSLGGGAPRGSRPFELLFDSALGLSEDNTVAIAGVKVGVVERISVDGRRARVTVRISPDVTVHDNARGAVRQKTLLGEKYVDFDPGQPPAAVLAPGSVIANNERTVDIDQVIRDVSVLVERLNNITPPLESAIARVDDALKEQDGKALVDEAVSTLKELRVLVAETNKFVRASGDDVKDVLGLVKDKGPGVLDTIQAASTRVDNLLAAVDPKLLENIGAQVGPTTENLNLVAADMKVAMGDMRSAARRFDVVLARMDGALKKIESLDEGSLREFFQIQGVRVNLIPDATVTTRIKKLREESVPIPE